jgi:class 3 adenylate cyclase
MRGSLSRLGPTMTKYKQVAALLVSIFAITIVHYTTRLDTHSFHAVHLFFRVMYVVPLICAAYWYRFWGGLVAFLLVTAVYLPHILFEWKGNLNENLNQAAFMGIFLVVTITTATLSALELRQRKKAETERTHRSRLQRYLSPLVVDEVLRSPEEFGLKGKDFDVSVLFADICGFTSLSEKLPPAQVMEILNEVFETFGEIVFKHEGTLNQIIGDAIFSIFGAPKKQDDHADRALQAAIELQERMDTLNVVGGIKLKIKIGINSGKVTAGSLGSIERMEYTVIGDTVNLASRLCDLAGPGEILVSADTRSDLSLDVSFLRLGKKNVKGRSQPVEVFAAQPEATGK